MGQIYFSKYNTTSTPLLANTDFVGFADVLTSYEEVDITCAGVPSNAPGTLYFEFSPDNVHWDISVPLTLPGPNIIPIILRVVLPYFRVRYLNGGTNLTELRLTTILHKNASTRLSRFLSQPIDFNEPINLTRSILVGKHADGTYSDVNLKNSGNMITEFPDNALDAFARLRTSNAFTVFDNKQLINNAPLFWDDQQINGSGTSSTYLTNQAASQMGVSNVTAGTRVRQTFRRFNYQPGKSTLVVMTGVMGSGSAGITKRVGYFDTTNGFYFELSGTTVNVSIRSNTTGSPINTSVAQNNWNIDKLDGTGVSGFTLDVSKAQIFVIDFQWLGVGRVRFGFFIDDNIYYCHEFLHANIDAGAYMSSPNLPLRYEISNDGTGTASNLIHICTSVISEGGSQETGVSLSSDRGATTITTNNNTNIYPIVVIRLDPSSPQATINPIKFTVLCSSNAAFRYMMILNPTVVGTALSFSGISGSAVQEAIPTNATTLTGGTLLISGYSQTGGNQGTVDINFNTALTLGQSISGTSDILALAIQRVTGTTETFIGSISWRETI